MTTSGSRFKIVPIESRYKRARWACWDYYDSDKDKECRKIDIIKTESVQTKRCSSNDVLKCLSKLSTPSSLVNANPNSIDDCVHVAVDNDTDNNDNNQLLIEKYGLERSLSATYNDKTTLDDSPPNHPHTDIQLSSTTNTDCSVAYRLIAIDSKIEKAMDLVKTHLMFAVREEVEILRTKIIQLQNTVLQLEAENAILRKHVPNEIVNKLSLHSNEHLNTTLLIK